MPGLVDLMGYVFVRLGNKIELMIDEAVRVEVFDVHVLVGAEEIHLFVKEG